MGARRRLLSIYIHLFSPLSREWASPLKKQLLVSGQPQEFPPPSAHTSGSRCCNRESQGFVFVHLTQSASRRSSVEREACSLFWWTWTLRMWVRSAQGHDQRFQTEAKATGGGANMLGRRDDIIPFFLEPALRPPEFQLHKPGNIDFCLLLLYYYCVCAHKWLSAYHICMYMSEDNLWSWFSSSMWLLGTNLGITRLGGKHLYLLNSIASLFIFIWIFCHFQPRDSMLTDIFIHNEPSEVTE